MTEKVMPEDEVSSIMTKNVLTVNSSDTLRAVLKMMLRENVGSIIVEENGKAVGIITERDITRLYGRTSDPSLFEEKVAAVMKSPLIRITPDTSIWNALEIMLEKDIRRLPVMKDSELLGIITERDIVVWVLKVAYEPDIPENLKKLIEKIEKLEKL